MEVNVYDFDKTIYDGDSSLDFYLFCARRKKKLYFLSFKVIFFYILYFLKLKTKTRVKEVFFSFLKYIDCDNMVNDFFESNKHKIKSFYIVSDHSNDIIISASPYFLLEKFADYLKVKDLIASNVDKNNGKFLNENCKGEKKVEYFLEKYPNYIINNFYTDSLSDMPLMRISKKSYVISGNDIREYDV